MQTFYEFAHLFEFKICKMVRHASAVGQREVIIKVLCEFKIRFKI
jgi:hypothetical protein